MNIMSIKSRYYSQDKTTESEIMKRSVFYTICTFFLGIFIIVCLYTIAGMTTPRPQNHHPQKPQPHQKTDISSPIQKTLTPTLSHYLVKTHQGKIVIYSVYSDGLTKLEKTLDVHPDSLRKLDKTELDRGIIIKDPEALSYIIEDYVS